MTLTLGIALLAIIVGLAHIIVVIVHHHKPHKDINNEVSAIRLAVDKMVKLTVRRNAK